MRPARRAKKPALSANTAKRHRVPQVDLDANPFCQSRQLTDDHVLMALNRNPQLHQPTAADVQQRITAKSSAEDDLGGSAVVHHAKRRFGARTAIEAATDLTTPAQAASVSAHGIVGAVRRRDERLAKRHARARAAAAAAAAGGAAAAPPWARSGAPPSFGHRPKSASRCFAPATMSIAHRHPGKGVTPHVLGAGGVSVGGMAVGGMASASSSASAMAVAAGTPGSVLVDAGSGSAAASPSPAMEFRVGSGMGLDALQRLLGNGRGRGAGGIAAADRPVGVPAPRPSDESEDEVGPDSGEGGDSGTTPPTTLPTRATELHRAADTDAYGSAGSGTQAGAGTGTGTGTSFYLSPQPFTAADMDPGFAQSHPGVMETLELEDPRRRLQRQRQQERDAAQRAQESKWDGSLIVSPLVRPEVTNHGPDPRESYRNRITRFREKAAGTTLHPLCQSKQVNDKTEMALGPQPHSRFGADTSMAPAMDARQRSEARHIRELLQKKQQREARLEKRIRQHERMVADDRIVAQMTAKKFI